MYTYKTVPAPMVLTVRKDKEVDTVIRGYSEIINAECKDGWEFYSMETITTQEPQGCLTGSVKTVTYNMLVFRKEA